MIEPLNQPALKLPDLGISFHMVLHFPHCLSYYCLPKASLIKNFCIVLILFTTLMYDFDIST